MHKTVNQVRIGTEQLGVELTISRVPESGMNGKTTYSFGVRQGGVDREFARLDDTDMWCLREAIMQLTPGWQFTSESSPDAH